MPLQLGLNLGYWGIGPQGEEAVEFVQAAERAGFDSVWVMDHLYQIRGVGAPDEPMLESYGTLAAIAARTTRARLGTLVTGVTYRNPALLAKIVTTLDVISSGRAILGIGAAWNEEEHEAYGYDFPPAAERLDRLEEAVRICRLMFTETAPTYEGKYHRVRSVLNSPRPVTPGGPPILVGGGGERRTLRLVAQYADACNLFGDVDTVRHKLGVLDRHCAEVGRDPSAISRTRLGTLVIAPTMEEARRKAAPILDRFGGNQEAMDTVVTVGDPDTVLDKAASLLDAGLDGLIFNLPDADDLDTVVLAGQTLSRGLPVKAG
jgi:F420-dependent oxidoreductase-like protein